MTAWLNNPNDTSTERAFRTSFHRLWLQPLLPVDPAVVFFRGRSNSLKPGQQLLHDPGMISGFKATSDLPQWMDPPDANALRQFLASIPAIEQKKRCEYPIDGRHVNFAAAVPIPRANARIPVWLAKWLGLLKIALYQALPAIWESLRR